LSANGVNVAQALTDGEGRYGFGDLNHLDPAPGSYLVTVDTASLPPGSNLMPSAAGRTATNSWPQTLLAGQSSVLDWLILQSRQLAPPQFQINPWTLNRSHGSLLGNVRLTNTNAPGSGPVLGPYLLGLRSSTNFFLANPSGTNRLPYVDLTAAVIGQVGTASLNPGQTVVLTNAMEIYSRTRGAPEDQWFEWVP
jgi:hypothetical protein